ncbi:hypothetical protein Vadar_001337 [Vaccinium darrowii]|uniref:Uncharacterized protein n=1 Tax=Vaccinium darrowii TaxID=229202 RepID=A0ACB7XVV7_9ERIC|nr:hypothetical protein Vadar_001337 [Vaccinium darrowii]
MEIDKLTEDLLMEILWRLPVKTLLQFKSVCKNWYALIQNPSFIYLHCDRVASTAAAQNTDCLLVKRFLNGGEGVALSLVPNETPVEDIDISSTGLDILSLQILGSCNGVVCLTKFCLNSNIVLCNLSMKEFRVLPQPSYNNDQCCSLGFGFDPFTNDYKVVRFAMSAAHFTIKGIDETVEIYDLRSDSWREVAAESPIKSGFLCSFDLFALWNGDFYWHWVFGEMVSFLWRATMHLQKASRRLIREFLSGPMSELVFLG